MIGDRRRRVGLTQLELAEVVGVSVKAMRRYEHGTQQPPLDTLCRLAHACDLPLSAYVSPLDPIRVPYREVRRRRDPDDRGDPETD